MTNTPFRKAPGYKFLGETDEQFEARIDESAAKIIALLNERIDDDRLIVNEAAFVLALALLNTFETLIEEQEAMPANQAAILKKETEVVVMWVKERVGLNEQLSLAWPGLFLGIRVTPEEISDTVLAANSTKH